VSDFLDLYFENEFVKGAFAFDGILANYADTKRPAQLMCFKHHAFVK